MEAGGQTMAPNIAAILGATAGTPCSFIVHSTFLRPQLSPWLTWWCDLSFAPGEAVPFPVTRPQFGAAALSTHSPDGKTGHVYHPGPCGLLPTCWIAAALVPPGGQVIPLPAHLSLNSQSGLQFNVTPALSQPEVT